MELELGLLNECEWKWGDDQRLLRNEPNIEKLGKLELIELDLYGVPYCQGGGRAAYTLVWDLEIEEEYLLVETRDFFMDTSDDSHLVRVTNTLPIWENARIVPNNDEFFSPVWAILTNLDA